MTAILPDLTYAVEIKSKYVQIHRIYTATLIAQQALLAELTQLQTKESKLQDEIDLVVDQITDSDYNHLKPAQINYFSDEEDTLEPHQVLQHDLETHIDHSSHMSTAMNDQNGNSKTFINSNGNGVGETVDSLVRKERSEEFNERLDGVKRQRLDHPV